MSSKLPTPPAVPLPAGRGDRGEAPPHPALPSPCLGLCRIDPDHGYCVGCYRSLEEICDWMTLAEAERSAVVTLCEHRKAKLEHDDSAS